MSQDNVLQEKIHIMLDFESLSLRPSALVLSCGLAEIMPVSEESRRTKYLCFNLKAQPERDIDSGTVAWWMAQATKPPMDGTAALNDILLELMYMAEGKEIILWANGTDFDISVLKNIAEWHSYVLPYKYSNVRDFRTVSKLFPLPEIHVPMTVNKHNALEDALWQARYLESICDYHNITLA